MLAGVSLLLLLRGNHILTLPSGYMNVVGYISIYASTIYGATLILVAAISINTGGSFATTKYINYGIFAATTFLTFGMTCVSSRVLNKLNTFYIFLQFAMLFALIIALAAATPHDQKNSASFVFGEFQNTGFWTNKCVCCSFDFPFLLYSLCPSHATLPGQGSFG